MDNLPGSSLKNPTLHASPAVINPQELLSWGWSQGRSRGGARGGAGAEPGEPLLYSHWSFDWLQLLQILNHTYLLSKLSYSSCDLALQYLNTRHLIHTPLPPTLATTLW